MKRIVSGLLFITILLVVIACAPSEPAETPAPQFRGPAGPAGAAFSTTAKGLEDIPLVGDRMIVRNGRITLLVEKVADAVEKVGELAGRMGGYVVSSENLDEGKQISAIVTVRVPAEKFDEALIELRKIAVRATSESTTSQDVTEEYTDLSARLRNLEATEKQYLDLMEKATTVEDVIKVQRELSSTRQSIEQIKGRMQYLERTSATSLITAVIYPSTSPEPIVSPSWKPLETFRSASRGLVNVSQWLADAGIWIAIFAPIWVPLGALGGYLYWRFRRKKAPTR